MVHLPRTLPLRPLARKEYDLLVENGCLEGERVELIRGFIVEMSPIGTRHAEAVRRLVTLFVRGALDRATVSAQSPFAVADHSEPEPDLALIPNKDFSGEHPSRAFLIVEVADSSLDYDRTEKARLYAESEVSEYWIVNLCDDVIEIHRDPDSRGSWRSITSVQRGATVSPAMFPDIVLAVDQLMPGR